MTEAQEEYLQLWKTTYAASDAERDLPEHKKMQDRMDELHLAMVGDEYRECCIAFGLLLREGVRLVMSRERDQEYLANLVKRRDARD